MLIRIILSKEYFMMLKQKINKIFENGEIIFPQI